MFLSNISQNAGYFYARNRQAYTVALQSFYLMKPIFDSLAKLHKEEKKKKVLNLKRK